MPRQGPAQDRNIKATLVSADTDPCFLYTYCQATVAVRTVISLETSESPVDLNGLWLRPPLFDTIICFNGVSQITPVPSQFEMQLIEGEGVEVAAGGRKRE